YGAIGEETTDFCARRLWRRAGRRRWAGAAWRLRSGGNINQAALARTRRAGLARPVRVKGAAAFLRVSLDMAQGGHGAKALRPGHGSLAVVVRRRKGWRDEHGHTLTNGREFVK